MELTASGVFRRYEDIRGRLPAMPASVTTRRASGLLEIADRFDLIIFDAFGVLVLGDTAIDGTQDVVAALKRAGKAVSILSNAATQDGPTQFAKYAGLGFPFTRSEIVSSRSILAGSLGALPHIGNWAAILPSGGSLDGLPAGIATPHAEPARFLEADGFLFLSSKEWTEAMQERLVERLIRQPAPLLVGNPDLVAPREHGLSLEPGHFAHEIIDRTGGDVRFFGKPFANAFDAAIAAAGMATLDRRRVAMVGDTLHTDILGGAAAGLSTVLVTGHGVLKDLDAGRMIEESGIRPDWIIDTI